MEKLSAATQNLKPERRHLTADLIAGLTFAVVNVPQAMAHALLATVNPVLGIYTLMVGAPLGAIFASSVFMNVSPTSALSVAAGAGLVGIPARQRYEALAGRDRTGRPVFGLGTAQRNVPAALVVAGSNFDDPNVLIKCMVGAVLILATLMLTANELGKLAPESVTERNDRNL